MFAVLLTSTERLWNSISPREENSSSSWESSVPTNSAVYSASRTPEPALIHFHWKVRILEQFLRQLVRREWGLQLLWEWWFPSRCSWQREDPTFLRAQCTQVLVTNFHTCLQNGPSNSVSWPPRSRWEKRSSATWRGLSPATESASGRMGMDLGQPDSVCVSLSVLPVPQESNSVEVQTRPLRIPP